MKRYSKQGLWSLFLICAFPLHVWTLILAFRDFSWIAERTNSWDAIGNISYALLYTFIESVVIFLVVLLLGNLISKKWDENIRNVLLGTLVLITSLWAIGNYLFFLLGVSIPGETINFLVNLKHPLRFIYAFSLALVGPTIVLPTYFILRSKKFHNGIQGLFDRLSVLTQFYLFFDFVGLIIIVIRNV
ncbi:MAG: hypothetical protein QGD88_12885 [Anaerolineae bacterium]|nr:hypothetical protein [Anaerolineae bacterium]